MQAKQAERKDGRKADSPQKQASEEKSSEKEIEALARQGIEEHYLGTGLSFFYE